MADRWTIWGREYGNCNCAWGCPCQFGAKTTYGHCEAVVCPAVVPRAERLKATLKDSR